MAELLSYSSFIEVAFLLILATAIGFLGLLFKQPLIVSFIAVGLLAGPSALDIVYSKEKIDFLSELGIATLLFLVGIKLDIKEKWTPLVGHISSFLKWLTQLMLRIFAYRSRPHQE
ncbi:hypothetical protein BOO33_07820 [Vibrio navarrensis]|nr:hypothetical protein [Vibrio navarrensis]